MVLGMNQIYSLLYIYSISSIAYARLTGEGIVGGDNAAEGQFPYQVSIQVLGSLHICGGGILSERFILTAAHCVIDKSSNEFYKFGYRVVAGTTDLNNRRKGRAVKVEQIFVLDSYQPPSRANDIAVLKLKDDIGLIDGLRKLELPKLRKTYVGQTAQFAGYGLNWIPIEIDPDTGKKFEGIGRNNDKLKYLNVTVINNAECRRKNVDQIVLKSNLCGQALQRYRDGQLEGVCTNDSGGPLVVEDTVIGVLVASPLGCEESKEAALYTRVSSFMKFIDNVMNGVRTKRMRVRDLDREDR